MARRILVFLLFLSCFVFAQDIEYIRSNYQGNDVTLVYLDGKEVLALLGNDQNALEKAVSIMSQLQLFGELKYNIKDLSWQKHKNKSVLIWGLESIAELSEEEIKLNNKRKNDLIKAAKNFVNHSDGKTIVLDSTEQGLIRSMVLQKKDLVSYDGVLPAIHAHYPLGTVLRLQNTETDWTVVIKVVDNDKKMEENVLGVDENVLKALGIKNSNKVKVQVL